MKFIINFLFTSIIIIFSSEAIAQGNKNSLIWGKDDRSNIVENWKKVDYMLLDSINLNDFDIFSPHALTLNNKNQLAVMAWWDRIVYIFDLNDLNNPIKLQTRMGRGPGEYEYPFDMFLNNNILWISDMGLRKVESWNIETNNLILTHNFNNVFIKPDQVAVCNNSAGVKNLLLLSTQYGPGINKSLGILHTYTIQNNKIEPLKTFQKLDNDAERYPYVIQGDLACTRENEFLYSGDFTGSIRKYNIYGDLIYSTTAVNSYYDEPLYYVLDNGNMTKRNPEAVRINDNIFYIDNKVYISRSHDKRGYIHGIDVYSEEDGSYIESYKIPAIAKEIIVTSSKLITVEYREDGHDLKIYARKVR